MLVKGQEEANVYGFGAIMLTRTAVLAPRERRKSLVMSVS